MIKEKLDRAQQISLDLFNAVEKRLLIVPGKSEKQLNEEISALAGTEFGIETHWHKKIVRAGKNTLANYPDNPPDRIIAAGDIVFIDLGPVVEGYEADIARTYVLGNDPRKIKLKNDVEKAWYEIRDWYLQQTYLPASALFGLAVSKAKEYGWEFSGEIAGHIVGKYPHEQPADPKSIELDIHPGNHQDIFQTDAAGNKRHWILELQFVDKETACGAYFEQLL